MKKLRTLLLMILLLMVAGCAAAEEGLFEEYGKLLWKGEFPETVAVPGVVERSDFESYIVTSLTNLQAEIDVSSYQLTPDEFKTKYFGLLNERPELFFVDGRYSYYKSGNYVSRVLPSYLYSGADLQNRVAAFNAEVNAIVSYAQKSPTRLGQLLLINDYFVANYEYDTSYSIYSPDQFFSQKKGVCQAYTLAFKAVLDKLNFVSTTASSDSMNHIWNMVQLDGSWYHVDVTWNDPITDVPMRACHDNFLLSDAGIAATSPQAHHDWVTSVTATSTLYDDYFWMDIKTPIPVVGSTIYYVDQSYNNDQRKIMAWDIASSTSRLVHTYSISVGGGYSYYLGYDPLAADASRIYYTVQNMLYSVSTSGTDVQLEHIAGESGYQVYASLLDGSVIKLLVGTSPNASDTFVATFVVGDALTVNFPNEVENVTQGSTLQLQMIFQPAVSTPVAFNWSSDNEAVATVAGGQITGVAPGAARITATHGSALSAECLVIVHCPDALELPAEVTALGAEAFENVLTQEIILSDAVTQIGERTFAGCTALKMVIMPDGELNIAQNAFEGCPPILMLCTEGSDAHTYAQTYGFEYQLIP